VAAFKRVAQEVGAIDILVNNVWGGYERMMEDGTFTWSKPFWEQPLWRWDAMFIAGVRAHYHASQLASSAMIAKRRGLIVNISFWAAQKHIGNVAYGVSKAATDKMTADMATELKPYGVAVVSLYPGLVRTEKIMEAAKWLDLTNSEIARVHRTGRRGPRNRCRCAAILRKGASGRRNSEGIWLYRHRR
jgi:NAD(P)-dependent dehydrogenase (short-subunit alcohol dehydrogenase family)